ncbi:unnamed protein product [Chrysoparadoxa australica]
MESTLELVAEMDWTTVKQKLSPKTFAEWWWRMVKDDPGHVVVESALVLFILYILLGKKTVNPKKAAKPDLSQREINELIEEWQPEPLVPDLSSRELKALNDVPVVEKVSGQYYMLEGHSKPLLNMASFDFLALGQASEMKDAVLGALNKYGCGSCGPRGFYGTIDVHMKIEEEIADFMGSAEAISYSDSASTVSSAIPAFAKKGDLVIVDRGCHEAIQTGVALSRSIVRSFAHNDMADLERVLEEIHQEDKRIGRNVLDQRRFIVVEGLYRNYGDIVPMPEVLELKAKYHYRLIMDEGFSFGVLGDTGRGVTELFQVPLDKVDIITISMANVLASIGGLCIGRHEVVDHQRLSAAGYCFSASAPPFTSTAASAALRLIKAEPQRIATLRTCIRTLKAGIAEIKGFKVVSSPLSPVIHVALENEPLDREDADDLLEKLALECRAGGVAVAASRYLSDEKYRYGGRIATAPWDNGDRAVNIDQLALPPGLLLRCESL